MEPAAYPVIISPTRIGSTTSSASSGLGVRLVDEGSLRRRMVGGLTDCQITWPFETRQLEIGILEAAIAACETGLSFRPTETTGSAWSSLGLIRDHLRGQLARSKEATRIDENGRVVVVRRHTPGRRPVVSDRCASSARDVDPDVSEAKRLVPRVRGGQYQTGGSNRSRMDTLRPE